MNTPMLMTPGPTFIHEDVRKAMAKEITNPDLDLNFFDYYQETCEEIKKIFHTKNDVFILSGEGILGLEAACCSLIEPGDRVLCIDNGLYGNEFANFAKIYGAEVTYYKSDYRSPVSVKELEKFLQSEKNFKVATLVHCETPSGITNPIDTLCPLLKKYGILTIVDSASGVGGEEMQADKWKIDIVLSGSQKCLSAAPGLTIISISEDAWNKIHNRSTPIQGFYCNLEIWENWYQNKFFPYTQPISDIFGLRKAIERYLSNPDILVQHKKIAKATRESLIQSGLQLYPLDGYSNTVTTICIPEEISYAELFENMLKGYNIMIGGGLGALEGKVFRIGHMGENCKEEKVSLTLKALDQVLRKYGVPLEKNIHKEFINLLD